MLSAGINNILWILTDIERHENITGDNKALQQCDINLHFSEIEGPREAANRVMLEHSAGKWLLRMDSQHGARTTPNISSINRNGRTIPDSTVNKTPELPDMRNR